jgi:hypothetical protein
MPELIADRVSKLFRGHLDGTISDREFRDSIREFSTDDLNKLVECIRTAAVFPPKLEKFRRDPGLFS